MRYGFLAEVAQRLGSDTVAVAHHADDQAESVLMHVIRGSGIAGLRGMRPKSKIGDLKLDIGYSVLGAAPNTQFQIPNIQLVRPLLYVTRAEIEAYCATHDLHPRFDVSNLDQTYFRNWLRRTVLPLLAQHNPGVRDVLCRTAEVAAADYDLLHEEMERAWAQVVQTCDGSIVFDLAAWRVLPLALKRATIREAIHRLRRNLRNINFVHVERAVDVAEHGGVGDRATLAEGLMLTLTYDSLTLADEAHRERLPNWPLLEPGTRVAVNVPSRSHLPGTGWALESELVAVPSSFWDNADPWTAFLDAEACSGSLVLRTRLPGDRIAPQGMNGQRVKLNEIMINAKVPRHVRDWMPVLVVGGRVLWACGLRIDERARITPATRRVLCLRFVATDESDHKL
jgi:tRNA(Ile)-lysidine synthetase-like protein